MSAAPGSNADGADAHEPQRARAAPLEQRPAWSVFRAALERAGFRPSRRLGQNFLLDENMARAIVRDAGVSAHDPVLEVGAGCGFLSLALAQSGVRLTCVEIDERLLAIARELLAGYPDVRWILCDALAGKHALSPLLREALPRDEVWHLVSNLPYSIAAPLLVVLADLDRAREPQSARAPMTMTALVQREVALRIAAQPATPEWGPLSIRLQLSYEPEILRSVAPALFWPRPEVESTVIRLKKRAERIEVGELERLDGLVRALFQHRRQTLGRALARLCAGREEAQALLERIGLSVRERAENLDLATLRRLAAGLR